jgi:hypothetical protein
VPVESLTTLRDRVLPMLEVVAREYAHRVPSGYPRIVDEPERGTVGLLLDSSFGLHFLSDGTALYAELTARASRTDARSSAGWEKFSGMPFNDRRTISEAMTDQDIRNLLSELMARWNMQPRIIHITDQ